MNHKQNPGDDSWGLSNDYNITMHKDDFINKNSPVVNEIQDNFKYKKILIVPIVLMILYIILFKK